ncbi:hypothetical protein EVJ58_g623 [Rhodofomes roseus]|uniref:Uncharacterized protein n=1 Tax=Rhodofomes roseus TaxID=34475 RepID=A0A4Y9Z6Q1_9APHY|nr:hypothetical protein EVJ58_g623 [Rhodofomes roseus]
MRFSTVPVVLVAAAMAIPALAWHPVAGTIDHSDGQHAHGHNRQGKALSAGGRHTTTSPKLPQNRREVLSRFFDDEQLYGRDIDEELYARGFDEELLARDFGEVFARAFAAGDDEIMARAAAPPTGSGALNLGKLIKGGFKLFNDVFRREDGPMLVRAILEEMDARGMDLDELD